MVIQSLINKAFKLEKTWRIHPSPSFMTQQLTVTDSLIDCLSSGSIISTTSIARFRGRQTVEFVNGTNTEIDAVVCCTGFVRDFSLVPELMPEAKDMWSSKLKSDRMPLHRLYQNVFPPSRPDSIAFLNDFAYPTGFMWIADLASMAVAQLSKGASKPPPAAEIEKEIDVHNAWQVKLGKREAFASDFVQEESWLYFMHGTAGTSVNENLAYRLAGWHYWKSEPRLTGLVMGGVEMPFVLRLFDGKRKKWDGARLAIADINEEAR